MYSQFEVQRGLPIQMLVKYFDQVGEFWQLKPEVRSMVQFRELNLLKDFSHLGKFDVIFCRNVLIYFDQATKIDVFNRLLKSNESDGYLFLGAAETVVGLTNGYRPCQQRRGVYVPNLANATSPLPPAQAVSGGKPVTRAVH